MSSCEMEFVGKTLKKRFKGFDVFTGTIQSYDSSSGLFRIGYTDGDFEELESSEVAALLEGKGEAVDPVDHKPRLGRKPKKRRRVEPQRPGSQEVRGERSTSSGSFYVNGNVDLNDGPVGDSGENGSLGVDLNETLEKPGGFAEELGENGSSRRVFDLNAEFNLNLSEEFDLNEDNGGGDDKNNVSVGHSKENLEKPKRDCIDLNLDVSGDMDENATEVMGTLKRECVFDLNLGVDDDGEIREEEIVNGNSREQVNERVPLPFDMVRERTSEEMKREGGVDDESRLIPNGSLVEFYVSSEGIRKEAADSREDLFRSSDSAGVLDAKCFNEDCPEVINGIECDSRNSGKEMASNIRRRGRRRKVVNNINSELETAVIKDANGFEKDCAMVVGGNQDDAKIVYQEVIGGRRRGRRKLADNFSSSLEATIIANANGVREDCTPQMDGNLGDTQSSYQEVSFMRRGRRRKLEINLKSISEPPVLMDANNTKDSSTLQTDGIHVDVEAPYKDLSGSRRKRRKPLDNLISTPEKTVLRRSSRKGSTKYPTATSGTIYDSSMSPEISELTEENTLKADPKRLEEPVILPLKAELPPCSNNLDLDGIPIVNIFSLYACLRSFSTLLFLSPFELKDFVIAVKSKSPNSLFDCIHVSILWTLRKHLEYLSNEGSESASDCLRSLNWGFLNVITWPVFMVEYLLIHGSELKPEFDLSHLKLLKSDYYKQPVFVKLELLRCLCDDMIEGEAIRSELSRRSSGTEFELDLDRNVNPGAHKKRSAVVDVSGGSCLTEEAADNSTDWNSDECCLCKMDGSLICCDGCPAAYHSKCVGVASNSLPEGDWYCPECAIDRHKPWMKAMKSLRGSEPLGVDPHGRLYFSSCGYLLVSDSCDMESSFSYYHSDDIKTVIEVLKSSGKSYICILQAVQNYWNMPLNSYGASSNLGSINDTMCLDTCMPSDALDFSERCAAKNDNADGRKPEKMSATGSSFHLNVESSKSVSQTCMCPEGSAETVQTTSGNQNCLRYGSNCCNNAAELSNVEDNDLSSNGLDIKLETNIASAASGHAPSGVSTTTGDTLLLQPERYVNYYSYGHAASSIAEVLMCKSSNKNMEDSLKSDEEMISAQMKVISQKIMKFHWPDILRMNADVQKEKCGWCFCCRGSADDSDCLFNMCLGSFQEEHVTKIIGSQPERHQKGYLADIIFHILLIENRLQGLLLGPWLNPHYSKSWRESVLKASDIVFVKRSLLILESNMHHLALSSDWFKHVDSAVTIGSASHIVTSSARVSSKNGVGKKKVRSSDSELNTIANCTNGLSMYWRRGGWLSRQLFNWKVLPSRLVSKAARQAGCMKIPYVLYPENSDFAKRSKCIVWRAAVESSKTAEQFALQIQELELNIKWDDIENTHLLSMLDKEAKKSIRLFKKAIIRRKSVEGKQVKYLLDFGKRRSIPDVVSKNGSLAEQSSSERKKYWLSESHVPLHLLKSFEEKRIARKSDKMTLGKHYEDGAVLNKPLKKKDFSYLFPKAERSEYHQCRHCNKDVPIREAVSCQYCKGFFHKRHVKKSAGSIVAECVYTCHKCLGGKSFNTDKKKGKSTRKMGENHTKCIIKSKRVPIGSSSIHLKNGKKTLRSSRTLRAQKKKVVVMPLRRSPRKIKKNSLQKKKVGRKKGKRAKLRKGTCKKTKKGTPLRKKRSQTCHSYWLNGLLFSRKPDDERVTEFRTKRLLASLQNVLDEPKCHLCCQAGYTSPSNYISCEMCGEWFHGDAFGLDAENVNKLIGFRCHACRKKISPICPLAPAMGSDECLVAGVQTILERPSSERMLQDVLHPSDSHCGSLPVDESVHTEDEFGSALDSKLIFA